MAAIGERDLRLITEILPCGGEPGARTFPGIVVAVELLGAKWPVVVRECNRGGAERGVHSGARRKRKVAIVAIFNEAGGEIAGEAELFGPAVGGVRKVARLLICAEAS